MLVLRQFLAEVNNRNQQTVTAASLVQYDFHPKIIRRKCVNIIVQGRAVNMCNYEHKRLCHPGHIPSELPKEAHKFPILEFL